MSTQWSLRGSVQLVLAAGWDCGGRTSASVILPWFELAVVQGRQPYVLTCLWGSELPFRVSHSNTIARSISRLTIPADYWYLTLVQILTSHVPLYHACCGRIVWHMKLPFDSQLSHPFLQCMSSKMGALITLNYLWSAIGSKEMLQAFFGHLLVCITRRKSNQKSSSCVHTSHGIPVSF